MRDLLFTIWLKAGKDASKTLELVESLVVSQFEIVSKAGARMIQGSVAGKTFIYQLPDGWSATDFISQLRLVYRQLNIGGASGGVMTEAEINTYVLDTANQVTNMTRARFGSQAGGRY